MPLEQSEVEQSELGLNPPAPESPESPESSERAYTFSISIAADGFTVDGEQVPDLPTLLKHVIALVNEHPSTNDANTQLEAGFIAGKEPIGSSTPH